MFFLFIWNLSRRAERGSPFLPDDRQEVRRSRDKMASSELRPGLPGPAAAVFLQPGPRLCFHRLWRSMPWSFFTLFSPVAQVFVFKRTAVFFFFFPRALTKQRKLKAIECMEWLVLIDDAVWVRMWSCLVSDADLDAVFFLFCFCSFCRLTCVHAVCVIVKHVCSEWEWGALGMWVYVI